MAISEELAAAFLDAELFKDDESNYGDTFINVAGCNQMFSILDALTKYCGVDGIRPETWDALCACILIGDGDCPECGGELRFLETDGRRIHTKLTITFIDAPFVAKQLKAKTNYDAN